MKKPEFVTFTGVDDRTDLNDLEDLLETYPTRVELGILLSSNNRDARFPSNQTIKALKELQAAGTVRIALHICGYLAKTAARGGDLSMFSGYPEDILEGADRIQLNGQVLNVQLDGSCPIILQWRGANNFPKADKYQYLFDKSGGRGQVPEALPPHPGDRLVGYAGGITPENVKQFIASIPGEGPFWIDMETGVRDDGWFSLEKMADVLIEVYGV